MEFVVLRGGSLSENSIASAEEDTDLDRCMQGIIARGLRDNRTL